MKRQVFIFLVFFLINFPFYLSSQENDFFGLKTIVIDPGHGGKDPGNLGTGRYKISEKDITLDVSLKISRENSQKQSKNMRDAKTVGFSIGSNDTEQKNKPICWASWRGGTHGQKM